MTNRTRVDAGAAIAAAALGAIRVVLADDHYIVREGVARLLTTQPDIEIVATCSDMDSLLATVDAERPDVVVTDIRMPPTRSDEGIRAAARSEERRVGKECRL